MSRDISPYGLRMPADLKAALERTSSDEKRSLNAEIVTRLQQTLERDRQHSAINADDPLANIFLSAEAISAALNVIMKSVLLSKAEKGELSVADNKVNYSAGDKKGEIPKSYANAVQVLSKAEQEIIDRIRTMPDEERKGVYRLLNIK